MSGSFSAVKSNRHHPRPLWRIEPQHDKELALPRNHVLLSATFACLITVWVAPSKSTVYAIRNNRVFSDPGVARCGLIVQIDMSTPFSDLGFARFGLPISHHMGPVAANTNLVRRHLIAAFSCQQVMQLCTALAITQACFSPHSIPHARTIAATPFTSKPKASHGDILDMSFSCKQMWHFSVCVSSFWISSEMDRQLIWCPWVLITHFRTPPLRFRVSTESSVIWGSASTDEDGPRRPLPHQ